MASTECNSCHQEVDWAVKWPEELNDKGLPKTVPVNHDSVDDPAGLLEVWREPVISTSTGSPATVLLFRYLKRGEPLTPGRHRGVSHFATCSHADQWRSKPRSRSTA
jgi:hypothetical protein